MESTESTAILISIDHETVGADPANSLILATGIVIGDTLGNIHAKKEFIYSFYEQINKGYIIDFNTVMWWTETEDKLKLYSYYITKCSTQKDTMSDVVTQVYDYLVLKLAGLDRFIDSPKIYFCAKSPKFDIAFLDRLFDDYIPASKPRASFRQDFDFATVNKLCGNKESYTPEIKYKLHNALDDALFQYKQLVFQLNQLGVIL